MAHAQYFICRASGIRRSFVQACEHRRFYLFVVGGAADRAADSIRPKTPLS
jgi:hypothetical protein